MRLLNADAAFALALALAPNIDGEVDVASFVASVGDVGDGEPNRPDDVLLAPKDEFVAIFGVPTGSVGSMTSDGVV